ncbi:hypothetical protein V1J52_18480 [Streptomyces sp. TRM 70351]|uniref:hypothetical protein n=1 Tax=Streptomyces sp. TRM 70351 TaxID=3116552 RepID=UPI002E7BEA21|nr:hypothetical protein [Streptomyces sp. TRM 70351]MEE1930148.1 hypothetical protein [Streptomyces sp. TRM 70351]
MVHHTQSTSLTAGHHAAQGATPAVRWDAGTRVLVITAGEGPAWEDDPGLVRLSYHGSAWIGCDRTGTPVVLDLHGIPDALARMVPAAPRGEGPAAPLPRAVAQGIGCWLDPDSNWLWCPVADGAVTELLTVRGHVEAAFTGTRLVRIQVRASALVEAPARVRP